MTDVSIETRSRRTFLKTVGLGAATTAWIQRAAAQRTPSFDSQKDAGQRHLVRAVRDLGVQFRDNHVNVTGQDAATSIVLPDNRALWIFGDTVEGPFRSIREHDLTDVLSNTGMVVPPQDASLGIKQYDYLTSKDGNRPRQLIPFTREESPSQHRLWAIHGATVNETVYLYYHKITMLPGTSVFDDFRLNGMGIARGRIGEFVFERLRAPDGSWEYWKPEEPGFGVFIDRLDDGYLYLWGSLWTGMFLARTRPESIEQLDGYEYLVRAPTRDHPDVQPKWSRQFRPTAVLFDAVPNEMSAVYNPHLRMHLAIHTYNRENKLVLRTAPRIWGPWSEPVVIHRPRKTGASSAFYAGKEHPELARQGGRVLYLTYIDSEVYMPHLLEVTLS